MHLWEIFSNLKEKSILDIEKDLDSRDYQPKDKVETDKTPVIDLDLMGNHFIQRLKQRSQKAKITPDEIEDLLHRGRKKFKDEIWQASKDDMPHQHIDFYDPETKLMIPAMATPNPECKPGSKGRFTCQTVKGPAPKNILRAKTIMRKGVDD